MRYKLAFVTGVAYLALNGCGGSALVQFPADGSAASDGGRPADGSADAPDALGAGGADGSVSDAQTDAGGAASPSYSVGGSVTGLAGDELIVTDGPGNAVAITANGTFTLGRVPAGSNVVVSVAQQPTTSSQVCTVTGGAITAIAHDVKTVMIVCVTSQFTVGGTVSGLTGTGLVLQDNSGDDLAVTASGVFVFATPVASGETFTVTIKTQPASPAQLCEVSGGSGTMGGAKVTSVAINCAVGSYTLGGTVAGLIGTGLVIENKGADDQPITANGTFAFPTVVHAADTFAVTIKSQPAAPSQTCSIAEAAGAIGTDDVKTVAITCSTNSYPVSGTVVGLLGSGLVLQDDEGDNLPVAATGAIAFPSAVASGSIYVVTVLSQPGSPSQTCVVTNGVGIVSAAAITNVTVTCTTSTFVVGGTVTGLVGSGLKLANEAGDALSVVKDGPFAFAAVAVSGAPFAVTIAAQPTNPAQTCAVSGGTGSVGGADVTTVTVNCSATQHVVGGTVTNLQGGGLALALNAGAPIVLGGNGTFAFPLPLAPGAAYAVTFVRQPTAPSQTCTLTGGAGTVAAVDVTGVVVTCVTNTFTVGGRVSGLKGTGLALTNNGGAALAVAADGNFVFATSAVSGTNYHVAVSAQPTGPSQTCRVANASSGVTGTPVTNVLVTCTTDTFALGGTISGLLGTAVVKSGTGDSRTLTSNGPFAFASPVASGGLYAVAIATQPTAPDQTCTVTAGTGTVGSADVASVTIACVVNPYKIGGALAGLLGTGLVLQDNAGDDLAVVPGVAFTFATSINSGAAFAVTIKSQPSLPSQTCSVVGGTGIVGAADVGSVTINCITDSYVVGGTVTGLLGEGLVLQYNGANDEAISGPGSFAFAPPLASGLPYTVTVKTQPSNPWQTCTPTGATGTISNADVMVPITCVATPYPVSVAVTNLSGTGLVLQNNGTDNLPVTAEGTFPFQMAVDSGDTYGVVVLSQPTSPSQVCTVTLPAGVVAGAGVTLAVNCVTSTQTIGGVVTGLSGTGLTLLDNGGDELAVTGDGPFTFAKPVKSGVVYSVMIGASPTAPAQGCVVTSGGGTVSDADISDVIVTCNNVNSCVSGGEHDTLTLTCPTGLTIASIDFASYGTPEGDCSGTFTISGCNATNSVAVVSAECVGKASCTVSASNDVFGDPCPGTLKLLDVVMNCL